jgi:hypothetical protein
MEIDGIPEDGRTAKTVCEVCGGPIPEKRQRRKAKTCKDGCRAAKQMSKYREINGTPINLPPTSMAVLAKMAVGIDLMKKGLAVFQSLAPSGSCDLLVLASEPVTPSVVPTWRVEVTTGTLSTSNKVMHSVKADPKLHDVIAIYLSRTGDIQYQPVGDQPLWKESV